MKLNKKVEFAIRAVEVLRTREGYSRVQDLVKEVGTTKSFLEQIMNKLRNYGIVERKAGPGGGYYLVKDINITAYLIAKAIGREFYESSASPVTAIDRLNQKLTQAYKGTLVAYFTEDVSIAPSHRPADKFAVSR